MSNNIGKSLIKDVLKKINKFDPEYGEKLLQEISGKEDDIEIYYSLKEKYLKLMTEHK